VNQRERFIATVLYQLPDRVPFFPGRPRKSTLQAWRRQGLPDGEEWFSFLTDMLGIRQDWLYADTPLGVDFTMIPQFEEKVLEHKEDSLIVQDWKGNICEISDNYDVTYLRSAIDFVTRKWIKCPVNSWEDWENMKQRYDPDSPSRFPDDLNRRCRLLSNRDRLTGLFFNGPFMQLREWLGFEQLCMAFIEQPKLVQDMLDFWRRFVSRMLARVFKHIVPDYVHVAEDMAYKEKAMISPAMTRDYILPVWQEWGEIVHRAGCPVLDVDSDGCIGELVPIWIEAGFNLCDPVEIAAGNDPAILKREFGNRMAYTGGVDKRSIAKGGDTIKIEMERLAPVVASGGFIPSCDHGIPSDISWPRMVEYSRLLAKITGWL